MENAASVSVLLLTRLFYTSYSKSINPRVSTARMRSVVFYECFGSLNSNNNPRTASIIVDLTMVSIGCTRINTCVPS